MCADGCLGVRFKGSMPLVSYDVLGGAISVDLLNQLCLLCQEETVPSSVGALSLLCLVPDWGLGHEDCICVARCMPFSCVCAVMLRQSHGVGQTGVLRCGLVVAADRCVRSRPPTESHRRGGACTGPCVPHPQACTMSNMSLDLLIQPTLFVLPNPVRGPHRPPSLRSARSCWAALAPSSTLSSSRTRRRARARGEQQLRGLGRVVDSGCLAAECHGWLHWLVHTCLAAARVCTAALPNSAPITPCSV